jgi:hypothetical protein
MSLPTLRKLTQQQYRLFRANIRILIEADDRIGLSEWCQQKFLSKHLGPVFESRRRGSGYQNISELKDRGYLVPPIVPGLVE